ncbi:MAG TPA: hypothetical protein VL860_10550 [Planctomycetota bacterium]|nr:hypothetical protein [Planctomycetota bacterium]
MSANLIVDDGSAPVTFLAAVNPAVAGQYVAAGQWTEVASDAWSFYDYPGRDGVFAKFLGARRNRLQFKVYLVGASLTAVRSQWQAWQTAWRGKALTITPPDDDPRANCIKRSMTLRPREYCPAGVLLTAVLEFEEMGG